MALGPYIGWRVMKKTNNVNGISDVYIIQQTCPFDLSFDKIGRDPKNFLHMKLIFGL